MKRCPHCNELNGDSRTTCFKCGKHFISANSWQSSNIQSWNSRNNVTKPKWNDIVLRTWNEQGELRLKEHSLSVIMSGKNTEIPLSQVISVSITKEPSGKLFPGMIEIKIAGSPDTMIRLNSFMSVGSGNVIHFPHDIYYKSRAHELQKYIVDYQAKPDVQAVTSTNAPVSAADEIKKYKELLDMGAITQDEFDAKKKQLLGL